MQIDIAFSKVGNEHFGVGEVITIKSGGSLWAEGEVDATQGLVTLEVTPELFDALHADIGAYKVDSVENPQAVIPGA
jgi:hypothetical protein